MQGRREERGPGTYGWLKMMMRQQYVRGTRWFGDYCCSCCCSSPAILPAGTRRMYLAYDTIIMDFLSCFRPFHCFLQAPPALAPPNTCNIMNRFNTTPYPSAAVCHFYGPSPLRLLPVLRACEEPQAGFSPPRRRPRGTTYDTTVDSMPR